MGKYLLVLCAYLALANSHTITVRDLADQAQKQLNDLKDLVQGEILAAHSEMSDTQTEFNVFNNNVYSTGVVALQQEHDSIVDQVNSWKDIARSGKVDPTSCTDARERVLDRLPQRYSNEMRECIQGMNKECSSIVDNANYIIDISFNKVSQLQNNLDKCMGNLLCIQPILKEIELNKIRLPQNIQTERQAADALIANLKMSSQDCADDKNAAYNTEATSILNDIIACINRLL